MLASPIASPKKETDSIPGRLTSGERGTSLGVPRAP